MAENLYVTGIELQTGGLSRDVRRAERELERLERRVNELEREAEQAGAGLENMGRKVAAVFAALGIGLAAQRMGRFIFETNKEFQKLEATLKTVEGSAGEAARTFGLITDFAVTTPFEVQNLTQSFVQLRAFGFKPTREELKGLGNHAAAFTRDITELANAVVSAANGMTRPLRGFGVQASVSGDQVELSFQGITRTVNRTTEDIARFVAEVGNTRFADAMAERMETLDGALSNLADTSSLLAREIGRQGLNQEITELVRRLDDAIQANDEFGRSLGQALARGVEVSGDALFLLIDNTNLIIDALELLATVTIARVAVPALANLGFYFRAAAAGALTLGDAAALLKGRLAFLGGPAGLIAGGIFLLHKLTDGELQAASGAEELAEELDRLTESAERFTAVQLDEKILALATRGHELRGRLREVRGELEELGPAPTSASGLGAGAAKHQARRSSLEHQEADLLEQINLSDAALEDLAGRRVEMEVPGGGGEGGGGGGGRSDAEEAAKLVERLTKALREEQVELEGGERALLDYQMAQAGVGTAARESVLALYDQVAAERDAGEAAEKVTKVLDRLEEQNDELTMSERALLAMKLRGLDATEEQVREALQLYDANRRLIEQEEELERREREREKERERREKDREQERLAELQQMKQAADRMAQDITEALFEIVEGTESVGDAFAGMVDDVLEEMARLMARRHIVEPLANLLGNLIGGAVGGGAGSSQPHFSSHVAHRASGGPVSEGRPYIVGEEGPELFIPEASGEVLPNGTRVGGGGGGPVNLHQTINFNVNAMDGRSVAQMLRQQKGTIVGVVAEGVRESESARRVLLGG